jgi:GDP-L-fucose synthase
MDVSRLSSLGWKAKISLEDGIRKVYEEVKDMQWSEKSLSALSI